MHRYRNIALSAVLASLLVIGLVFALNGAALAESRTFSEPAASQSISPVAPDHTEAISEAMAYLESVQAADGSFGDEFATIKAVLAAASARYPMDYLTSSGGHTALDYLETQAMTYTRNMTGTLLPSRLGILAVAAVAGDASPYAFGGVDLIHELTGTYHTATGAYSTTASAGNALNQIWSVLGLAAAQEPVPAMAVTYLVGLQDAGGGWDTSGWGPDVDSTALALQALMASGHVTPTAPTVIMGVGYLQTQQQQGSWGYNDFSSGNYTINPDSTAAAIQALAALGYTPATESWADGSNPHDALASCQQADGSVVARDTVSDTFVGFWNATLGTVNSVPGLAEASLPIFGREQRARLALTWMQEAQQMDGSWGTEGATLDAVLAYIAAGFDPDTVMASGSVTSAIDHLEAQAASYVAQGPDEAGKLALAVELAGGDVSNFGGVNLVDLLTNTYYSATLQAFGVPTNTYEQAFPILGLAAAGEALPEGVTTTLAGLQQADGGWKLDLGPEWWKTTSPDNTGLAMQALVAGGVEVSDTVMVSATQYLAAQQMEGGWGSWGTVNANSTAYAMQGLLAAGEDLASGTSAWRQNGRGPFDALAALQKPDGPFVWAWAPFGYTDNGLATWQAVPALLGVSYPFTPGSLAPFAPVERGPDPDRIVTAAPRATLGNSVDLLVPFGSDLNRNATVTMTWRLNDSSWQTTTVHRANGYFTSTIAGNEPGVYDVRVLFDDPDGVQGDETVTTDSALTIYAVRLPLVMRNDTP